MTTHHTGNALSRRSAITGFGTTGLLLAFFGLNLRPKPEPER